MSVIYEKVNDTLVRAYSDKSVMIADENGSLYCDAVDLISLNTKYTETDIAIEDEEATIDDYKEALVEMGVDLNEEE